MEGGRMRDDRLYWWDGTDGVILSEKMDDWLRNLALYHREISQNMSESLENANEFLKEIT